MLIFVFLSEKNQDHVREKDLIFSRLARWTLKFLSRGRLQATCFQVLMKYFLRKRRVRTQNRWVSKFLEIYRYFWIFFLRFWNQLEIFKRFVCVERVAASWILAPRNSSFSRSNIGTLSCNDDVTGRKSRRPRTPRCAWQVARSFCSYRSGIPKVRDVLWLSTKVCIFFTSLKSQITYFQICVSWFGFQRLKTSKVLAWLRKVFDLSKFEIG